MCTRRVHNRTRRVGSPYDDMYHDGLPSTGDSIEAISHTYGHILVRYRHGFRGGASLRCRLGKRLNEWGEVSPPITEKIFDAAVT